MLNEYAKRSLIWIKNPAVPQQRTSHHLTRINPIRRAAPIMSAGVGVFSIQGGYNVNGARLALSKAADPSAIHAVGSTAWDDKLRLVGALQAPGPYPHPVGQVELVETHISWVLLAGEFAYKLKKPVRLGFLDFGTLESRRFCCREELRLNRRTAPELYLDVVPITGDPEHPRIGGTGRVIEYAVKMRRFPQDALADAMARRGDLRAAHMDSIAATIAEFHARIPVAPPDSAFGAPDRIATLALQNLEQIAALNAAPGAAVRIERLRAWTLDACARLRDTFAARAQEGWVRECHGDLHLGNIAFLDGRPAPFDCIEFNPALRWIDVMSETAFLVMDLLEHRLDGAAWRFLNAYLEASGDYAGVRVLRFYLVYRALVRAKVARIRATQPGVAESARLVLDGVYDSHLALAETLTAARWPALVLMHGLSGSGKTTVAQALLERIGAMRVRSDVERKRLHGLDPHARTRAALDDGIYADAATRQTYARLKKLARTIIQAGFPAIVDAAFLRRTYRDVFHQLAAELGVPVLIVSCRASPESLRSHLALRQKAMSDASEAGAGVLERQIATEDLLGAEELVHATLIDAATGGADLTESVEDIAIRLVRSDTTAAVQ